MHVFVLLKNTKKYTGKDSTFTHAEVAFLNDAASSQSRKNDIIPACLPRSSLAVCFYQRGKEEEKEDEESSRVDAASANR